MKLGTKILIGMIAGIIVGVLLTFSSQTNIDFINYKVLDPIGKVFINLIQLIVIPFILSSLVVGVASLGDPKKIGRYGLKVFILYLITTIIALFLGILAAKLGAPGKGLNLVISGAHQSVVTPSIMDTILGIIPKNPFESLSGGNTLQVIVLSILIGLGIAGAGEKGKPVYDIFDSLNHVIYEITNIIMKTTPIGVFVLITMTVSSNGIDVFIPLAKYMLGMIIVILIHAFVTYSVFIKIVAKMNPIKFLKGMFTPLEVAFTTCTGITVMPLMMDAMKDKLGVSEKIVNFTVPFGMTVKKDGAAIFHGFTAIFISQAYGIDLSISQMAMLCIIVIIVSFSSAGIPGGGIIMLTMVLSSIGLPLEGIALIAGIDRVTDMFRTAINVLGVAACGVGLASMENEIDRDVAENSLTTPI